MKNTTLSNGNVCYTKETLCQPGDYAIKGGYCYYNLSDVSENMEKTLKGLGTSKNYMLGVVTKVTKHSDTKIVLRVVAEKEADGTSKALPDDLRSSLLDKYKNMFRNSEEYKLYNQKYDGPVIDMQGGGITAM